MVDARANNRVVNFDEIDELMPLLSTGLLKARRDATSVAICVEFVE
jgi:hypothetical protein